ncbi:MAG: alpha/beta fold hydrolase [Thermoguttaceae bacterium]
MKILFLHGWKSTPGGVKPTYLKDHGHEVLNPALPDDDFAAAVRIAQAEFDQHLPDVVVGSSRGGAVAMNVKAGDAPLVLLCPAWRRWGSAKTVKFGTAILHSPADDVVPFEHSLKLVRRSGLPESALIVVGHEHRLADPESLAKMLETVEAVFAGKPQLKVMLEAVGKASAANPVTRMLEAVPRLFSPEIPAVAREAGAPRQFGVGILMVITAMYAVLFSVLQAFGWPPIAFGVIGGLVALFFTAIGLGQMLLFQGKRPRRASVIVGGCLYPSLVFGGLAFMSVVEREPSLFFGGVCVGIVSIPIGAALGYLAGLLIAGVFLVIDMLGRRRGGGGFARSPKGGTEDLPPQTHL